MPARSSDPQPSHRSEDRADRDRKLHGYEEHAWSAELVRDWDQPLALLDEQGRVCFTNKLLQELLGTEGSMALFADLVHSEDRSNVHRALDHWLSTGCPTGSAVEARLRSTAATYLWQPTVVRRTVKESAGETPNKQRLVLVGRDVTHERRFEAALQESELRHRALLAGVLDPLIVIDSYGMVQSVSDSVLTVLGYRPEELVGRNISLLLPEPHRSSHDAYLANYRRTGMTSILGATREFEITHRDGTPLHIELSVSRVDVPGREEPLFTGSIRDVTARKRAEERLVQSEALLRAIFDQEFQLVALLDLEGRCVELNQRCLSLLGLERQQTLGHAFLPMLQGVVETGQRPAVDGAWSDALDGRFARFRADILGSGAVTNLDLSLKLIQQGGEPTFVLVEGRDITELEQAKRRESEILQNLAVVGESAALLAHEIKTPVSAVHHALRAVADRLGQEDQDVLGDLARRMQRLESTLKTTLSFVGPIELNYGPCVLPDLALEVVRDHRQLLGERKLTVELTNRADLVFEADGGRLTEILSNLVGNAGAILPEGGRIELDYEVREGQLCLRVLDDGPGIPPELRDQLFQPYATGRRGGTGLGLAISRRLAEAHGGSLNAIPSPLGGAGFELQIPTRPRP